MLNVYVSATRQNDGKTAVSLGLVAGLQKRFPRVGYMKPVGQQVNIFGRYRIDKDVSLMSGILKSDNIMHFMSPVAIPSGFTEKYIIKQKPRNLSKKILTYYTEVSKSADIMVIEGTGHAGVGSVIDLSNADVAHILKIPVIIVSSGGIGKPIDEIMLNKALFDLRGVTVIGAVINKVIPEKYDKISKFIRLGLKQKGIDVLGIVPYYPKLANPTVREIIDVIGGNIINESAKIDLPISSTVVGLMPATNALKVLRDDVLLITPGNREDLILTAITSNLLHFDDDFKIRGLILTGGVPLGKTIMKAVHQADFPIITCEYDTYKTSQKINNIIIKLKPNDTEKIAMTVDIMDKYIDYDLLIAKLKKYPGIEKKNSLL